MQLPKNVWAVIVIAVAAAVVIAVVVVWIIPSTTLLERTGLAIANQTLQSVSFDITSSLRSGRLEVGQGTMGTFDVGTGLTVPGSFDVVITSSGGGILSSGNLNPGVDCWAYFVWNGNVLQREPSKICT